MRLCWMARQAQDVLPEARHFNPIIRAEALGGALEQASNLISEMDNSALGSCLRPDVESFNALLEVLSIARHSALFY